jgi:hypothetical protein
MLGILCAASTFAISGFFIAPAHTKALIDSRKVTLKLESPRRTGKTEHQT